MVPGAYDLFMPGMKILISGAGIAGPTVAYWLLKAGHTPVLVERAPKFRTGGYMIDFWGIGFDVAERMDLIAALRVAGYRIERIEFVAADGKKRSGFGGNVFQRSLGNRFISIPRGDLASAIYDAVKNDVETIFGDSVASVDQNPRRIEVTFERGRPQSFDLLIGADGLKSTTRAAVFGVDEQIERFLGYYAASFVTSSYPNRDEHTYLSYAAPGRQISRYALRDDRTAFLFVFEKRDQIPGGPVDLAARKQILCETFSRDAWIEWPEIEKRLNECEDLYFDAVSQITLPAWSKGRTVLIGDAAYCPSLLAGEGTSFAMAGAFILAGELGRAGGDYTKAFTAYESCFRPFIERKQKSARSFASSFAPKSRFGLFIRDQVLRLGGIPVVGDFLMGHFVADRFQLPNYEARQQTASRSTGATR